MSPLRALSLLAVYLPTALAAPAWSLATSTCNTFCAYRTHPIEEKCEWSDCNGCGECTRLLDRV